MVFCLTYPPWNDIQRRLDYANQRKIKFRKNRFTPFNGVAAILPLAAAGLAVAVALFVLGGSLLEAGTVPPGLLCMAAGILLFLLCLICFGGVKVVHPNEAVVLTLFGSYYGTPTKDGCFWVNPFCSTLPGKKVVSMKLNTLKNEKQKVNDAQGNPVLIGSNVIWRVVDPTKAVFNVEHHEEFISIQTDSTIRNIARLYPYDLIDEEESDETAEKTLRSSSQEIAASMWDELQKPDAMEREILAREKTLKQKRSAQSEKKQLVLRLPKNLWDEVAQWSEEDFRSINGQIEYILTDAVRRHKGQMP